MKTKSQFPRILSVFFIIIFYVSTSSAKDVCRLVDGVWDKTENPYNATCGLMVPEGKILTIKEGVKINFKKDQGLKIRGKLIIQGTDSEKVILMSTNPAEIKWNGIDIDEKGSIEAVHCVIDNSNNSIQVNGNAGKIILDNCIFKNNIRFSSTSRVTNSHIYGILVLDDGYSHQIKHNKINGYIEVHVDSSKNIIEENTIISDQKNIGINTFGQSQSYFNAPTAYWYSDENIIKGNTISNCHIGMWISGGSKNFIENNIVKNNKQTGIRLGSGTLIGNIITDNGGFGIDVTGSVEKINNNQIVANKQGNLKNDSSNEIDAKNNWWGSSDESKITAGIFDYFQDASKGVVNFQPFLKEKPFKPE